jgi:chromate transporter
VNQDTMHQILHMLWSFGQLSVLGFGGGKGIIPQMHVDVVEKYQWVTNDQFTQFYTIGKLVPGPTTIFAALIGYTAMPEAPVLGALVATIGMFVPSSMIMVGADIIWDKFKASPWRAMVSHGLAPAIVGLVWASVYSISKGTASGPIPYTITALVVLATLRTKLSAPLLIGISGVLGMVLLRQ